MTKIVDLNPLVGPLPASAEFVINNSLTDEKCTASDITNTVANDLLTEEAVRAAADTILDTNKVDITGGIITGALAGIAPVANQDFATKLYIDTIAATKADLVATVLDAASTGVTAPATPISGSTVIATTAYVGAAIEVQTVLNKTTVASTPFDITNVMTGTFEIDHTAAAPVVINLAVISTFTNPKRILFNIIDTGGNSTTNSITINPGAGDSFLGLAGPLVITTDYASVSIANNGSDWYVTDFDATTSTTEEGKIQLATDIEAIAVANTTKAITPSTLKDTLEAFPYNITELGSAAHVLTESDTGTLPVTRTLTGACAITLPDPGLLTNPKLTHFAIYDAGAAATFNITITTAGGNIDGSGDPFVINQNRMGAMFIPDATATNWISVANTNGAFSGGATTPWQYNGIDIYFDQKVTIGDTTTTNSLFNLDKSTGDVGITFSQNASPKFILGINDTTDNFSLATGGTLGTGDVMVIDNTTNHMAFGPVAVGTTVGYLIQNTADAPPNIMLMKDSTGVDTFVFSETGVSYQSNGAAIGSAGVVPGTVGFLISGNQFHTSFRAINDQIGIAAIGVHVRVATPNPGFRNIGIEIECSGGGTGNAALVIASGDIETGTGTGTKICTDTIQKLSFWGATPVVQPSSTGVTAGWVVGPVGPNVGVDDTFTGNSGPTAYTLGDLVYHLKNIGILQV